ncbi:YciI family protein [Scrofimicrobium sp. R131]|uniref:YciI family protein n=1 Tax=Scrofimicrobium appendicitidis TaxID=3079930 RepID=A0AAU7V515_9ACTO
MALYVIEYRYDEDLSSLVNDFRPAHREYLRRLQDQGNLVASGFLRDAVFNGALLILNAETAQQATALLNEDPFVTNGLIHSFQVREWHPTLGYLADDFDKTFPAS